jgi:hypothetical protein
MTLRDLNPWLNVKSREAHAHPFSLYRMADSTGKYIDLTTDFGFKRLFENDRMLIRFLNAILGLTEPISSIVSIDEITEESAPTTPVTASAENILDQSQETRPRSSSASEPVQAIARLHEEEPGRTKGDKLTRFDIVCMTSAGHCINIEMQKNKQRYYFHRALYYSARFISRQGYAGKDDCSSLHYKTFRIKGSNPKGVWKWDLYPTYHIGVLAFDFSRETLHGVPDEFKDRWLIWSNLAFNGPRCLPPKEGVGENNLLNICLISIPRFRDSIGDAVQAEDKDLMKFLWLLSFLGKDGEERPLPTWFDSWPEMKDYLRVCKLDPTDYELYQQEIFEARDRNDELMTALDEGIKKGRTEAYAESIVAVYELCLKFTDHEQAYSSAVNRFPDYQKDLDRHLARQ